MTSPRSKLAAGDRVRDLGTGDTGTVLRRSAAPYPRHALVRWSWTEIDMDTALDRLVPYAGSLRRREHMTHTLQKLSGKAIRLTARYLAMAEMGGSPKQSPDEFYNYYTDKHRCSHVEAERIFGKLTDTYEERLRDEEGFLASHGVYAVLDVVRGKLKDGFFREGEVATDHHHQGAPPDPGRKGRPTPPPPPAGAPPDIQKLLKQLAKCDDPGQARLLRRALRKLGHKGGLRGEA